MDIGEKTNKEFEGNIKKIKVLGNFVEIDGDKSYAIKHPDKGTVHYVNIIKMLEPYTVRTRSIEKHNTLYFSLLGLKLANALVYTFQGDKIAAQGEEGKKMAEALHNTVGILERVLQ